MSRHVGGGGGFLAREFRMGVQMMAPLAKGFGKIERHGGNLSGEKLRCGELPGLSRQALRRLDGTCKLLETEEITWLIRPNRR